MTLPELTLENARLKLRVIELQGILMTHEFTAQVLVVKKLEAESSLPSPDTLSPV